MTDENVHRYKGRFFSKEKLTRINRLRDVNNSEEDRESDDLSPDLSNDQSITDKRLYADFRIVDLKFMITQITKGCINCKFAQLSHIREMIPTSQRRSSISIHSVLQVRDHTKPMY